MPRNEQERGAWPRDHGTLSARRSHTFGRYYSTVPVSDCYCRRNYDFAGHCTMVPDQDCMVVAVDYHHIVVVGNPVVVLVVVPVVDSNPVDSDAVDSRFPLTVDSLTFYFIPRRNRGFQLVLMMT
jgi:hypothetical protein